MCVFGVGQVTRSIAEGGLDNERFRLDILNIVSILHQTIRFSFYVLDLLGYL